MIRTELTRFVIKMNSRDIHVGLSRKGIASYRAEFTRFPIKMNSGDLYVHSRTPHMSLDIVIM